MTIGQLDFEGREITAVEVKIPGMGSVDIGELPLAEVPMEGDRIKVELEMVFGKAEIGSKKPDAFTGFTSGPTKRAHEAFIVGNTVKVTGFLRAAAVEELWQQAHAETA